MFRHLVTLTCGMFLSSSNAMAAPALWKVSDADSAIWLFGSVHALPGHAEWRTLAFDKVLAKADKIYFETDISPAAQADIAPLSVSVGFNTDGHLLSDIIGPEMTSALRDAVQPYQIPMPMLLAMKPWMAATTVSVGALVSAGYDPAMGVDALLSAEIPMERKAFLETPEQQLAFLAGGDESAQIAMLEATIDSLDTMRGDMDALLDAWLNGEPESIDRLFQAQSGGFGEAMLEQLIDVRNQNWVDQIESILARDEDALLIVGAAHLVGDASVIKLLVDRGYASERVQ